MKNDGVLRSVAGMLSVLHLYTCISPASSVLCYILVLLFSVVSIFWCQEKSKNFDSTDAVLNSKFIVTQGSDKVRVLLEM